MLKNLLSLVRPHMQVTVPCLKWKGINCKQSTRWQHLCRLKAKKNCCYETQQLILWTGTAIWWMTEPHYLKYWCLCSRIQIEILKVTFKTIC
jgi:hypothetical protein